MTFLKRVLAASGLDYSKFDELFKHDHGFDAWYDQFGRDSDNQVEDYKELYADFIDDLKRYVKVGSKGIIAYRSVRLKSIDDLNVKSLGTAWAYWQDAAQSYIRTSRGTDFVLVAEVPLDSVDYDDTMEVNIANQISEHELRCDGEIFLLRILDDRGKVVKEYDPPLKTDTGNHGLGVWNERG